MKWWIHNFEIKRVADNAKSIENNYLQRSVLFGS